MQNIKDLTIAEIVAKDFRTSDVFRKHQIDFCCGGKISLLDAKQQYGIEPETLFNEITEVLNSSASTAHAYNDWELDFLADFIERTHHQFVRKEIPVLEAYLSKIADVHGDNHPELHEVKSLFHASANALLDHLEEEENLLFPKIRLLVKAGKPENGVKPEQLDQTIIKLVGEHETEGDRFKEIAKLTAQYSIPEDACNTYMVAISKLDAFEKDLHQHIHLENNILFPKAIALESLILP
ncbi:MAG: iron-sulfur cluster repair di-iron protein [Bacteroidetes bacterium]|nr:iron-sulfur cluster repair di-iron protein [Bacteroidota bacterium]MBU1578765.1 iron-sulfur cluster repair di-iron protein [Bacteroidota bacterium]MBU2466592.1 iron-sulfur cluster repair di-iron protein [Bacteroidota bacterium]MBU2558792.1 iron-sulfur cluster repair di-iron protein [Bacteroidota bacterium]